MMPPLVSMPRDSGVTSISRTSLRSPLMTPDCTAAPTATTSSGFTDWLASLPPVSSLTSSLTAGIRVEPPTRTTWSMSETPMPASRSTLLNGVRQRPSRSEVISSKWARVRVSSRCTGVPSGVMARYCMEMEVLVELDSSFLACSAASFRRCRAILSLLRSTPYLFLTSPTSQSMIFWSQSSPPRWLSPLVACT